MGASALATTPTWSGALTATAKPGNDPYLHPGGIRTIGDFDYDQVALLDGPALTQREMTMAVVQTVPENILLSPVRHQATLPTTVIGRLTSWEKMCPYVSLPFLTVS